METSKDAVEKALGIIDSRTRRLVDNHKNALYNAERPDVAAVLAAQIVTLSEVRLEVQALLKKGDSK